MSPSHDAAVAHRARRRITSRLMPYLLVLYFMAYVDRTNLGVAKLQMEGELNFTDEIIGLGAGVFFLGYFLLEVPGSIIVERWSARKWLARIMVSWGFFATLMGFIGTPLFGGIAITQQFYGLRFLLGAAEAGFFPGVIVYLSHWFRYEDRVRAKALFMIAQPISIVIGLPVSRWILENVHWYGMDGWRWVFILEGLPSIFLGIFTLFYLTDWPDQAGWLPQAEKQWLTAELKHEENERTLAGRVGISAVFREPQVLLLIAVYFLMNAGNQALIFFLPSIAESMKGMPVAARTAVASFPYLCGIAGILLNGISAQRTGERRWHTAGPMLATGTNVLLASLTIGYLPLTIVFFCLAGSTAQAYLPVFWTLPTSFLGKSAAATAIGLINSLGNLGGFTGPYLFGYLKTLTGRFEPGLWLLSGFILLAGILATFIRVPKKPGA